MVPQPTGLSSLCNLLVTSSPRLTKTPPGPAAGGTQLAGSPVPSQVPAASSCAHRVTSHRTLHSRPCWGPRVGHRSPARRQICSIAFPPRGQASWDPPSRPLETAVTPVFPASATSPLPDGSDEPGDATSRLPLSRGCPACCPGSHTHHEHRATSPRVPLSPPPAPQALQQPPRGTPLRLRH